MNANEWKLAIFVYGVIFIYGAIFIYHIITTPNLNELILRLLTTIYRLTMRKTHVKLHPT